MVTALWVTLAIFTLISTSLLRATVRLTAKKSDNGWDNALTYVAVTGVLVAFPIRWMVSSHSIWLIALAPAVLWVGQAIALRLIYQVSLARAVVVGALHSTFTALAVGLVMFVAGMIVAYVLYGKIVSDPLGAILILLRWLGVPLPFEAPSTGSGQA
ncbi:MAG: hypothetical protein HYV07_14645 [Deltaproteobacteria bacterium]|nr:hypothetical protein [Deltaproteobacteria bacterium]